LNGERWRIWECALLPACHPHAHPGEILGAVFSPVEGACGQLVACTDGAIILLAIENDEGKTLRGRQLSDQQWQGQTWQNLPYPG
jgi:hypothetical protein